MRTLLCCSIPVHDVAQALADAQEAKSAGADLAEFRVDGFFDGFGKDEHGGGAADAIVRISSLSVLPCIVTCRAADEGGEFVGEESDRVSLYERLGTASEKKPWGAERPPLYLDFELSSFERSANIRRKILLAVSHGAQLRDVQTRLVLSLHDAAGRPADLSRRLARLQEIDAASVVKVAYRARSLHDALEVLSLPKALGKPTIALGMGEFGVLTRVLGPKFGSFASFASLSPGGGTAPGQLTLAQMLSTYNFRSIHEQTRVFGVIGYPVSKSFSPLVHNAGFAKIGFQGVYVPLPIAHHEGDSEATYAGFRAGVLELVEHDQLCFDGASVTMPHKEHLARLAREQGWDMDADTLATGAANTLFVRRDLTANVRGCSVRNTDVPAARAWVREGFGGGPRSLLGVEVGVIGAGGVGKAAAYALAGAGAEVVLFARDAHGAESAAVILRESLHESLRDRTGGGSVRAVSLGTLASTRCDAFVQCTPVGMLGTPDEGHSVFDGAASAVLVPGVRVFETVTAPVDTATVLLARKAGAEVFDGVGLFARQAALQFAGFTQRHPRGKLNGPTLVAIFEALVRDASRGVEHAAGGDRR